MNPTGISPLQPGVAQVHQTSNPTSVVSSPSPTQNTPVPANAGGFGAPVAGSAGPAYPVALIPAYIAVQPQFFAGNSSFANPAAPAASGPGGDAASLEGAPNGANSHITANPTSAFQSGFGGFDLGAFAAPGLGENAGFGVSPVLIALGFPVLGFYGAPVASSGPAPAQSSAEPLAGDDAVVVDDAVVPVAEDGVAVEAPLQTQAPPPLEVDDSPNVIDVVPPAADSSTVPGLPTLPIAEVSAADFAKYRSTSTERQSEHNLSLQLSTLDGDSITLEFNQIDVQNSSDFSGKTLDGEKVTDQSFLDDSQRLVNIDVTGDLSDEERAAIDTVISSVIDVVTDFFSGNLDGAVNKLKALDFDTSQLAELSLQASVSKTAVVNQGYHDGVDQIHNLKSRDADIAQALDFLASEQRRLVDVAGSVLDTPSAAKLVKSLLPPLLSEPFADLQSELVSANEVDTSDPVADDAPVAVNPDEVAVATDSAAEDDDEPDALATTV